MSGDKPIVAASSEGALFEYASSEDVAANLAALKSGCGCRFIVGSVTRNDDLARTTVSDAEFELTTRGTDGTAKLAETVGYRLDKVTEALLSDQVRLVPA